MFIRSLAQWLIQWAFGNIECEQMKAPKRVKYNLLQIIHI